VADWHPRRRGFRHADDALIGKGLGMNDVTAAAIQDLAASGVIRTAINTANPVLARQAPTGGELSGVSVDIAREVGRRLGRPVPLIACDTAASMVDALARNEWDVAFLVNEPARADRRAPSASAALELFYRARLEAAAGVRQALETFAATKADVRVLPDAFMAIRQTVASPSGRDAGNAYLQTLIQDLKASGWICAALDRNGQRGVAVAA
jgi:polar amino acid transport system substrate-binding protein